jgi:hypothetical protein
MALTLFDTTFRKLHSIAVLSIESTVLGPTEYGFLIDD